MTDTAFMTSTELRDLAKSVENHNAKISRKKEYILSDPSEMEDLLRDHIRELVSSVVCLVRTDSAEGGYWLKRDIERLAKRRAEILVGPMEG